MRTAVSLALTRPVENSPALSIPWLKLLKVAQMSLWAVRSGTTCSLLLPYLLEWVACKSGSNLTVQPCMHQDFCCFSFMFAWSICLASILFQHFSYAYYLHGMIYSWSAAAKLYRKGLLISWRVESGMNQTISPTGLQLPICFLSSIAIIWLRNLM